MIISLDKANLAGRRQTLNHFECPFNRLIMNPNVDFK